MKKVTFTKNGRKLLFIVMFLMCRMAVWGFDFEVDGIYYNITSVENKEVEVTIETNYWPWNASYSGSVNILATVEYEDLTYTVIGVGNNAFRASSNLTSITLPSSITSIGFYAFSDCSSLTSIEIPNGVSTIGNSAFRGCSSLTTITIPDGVTRIEAETFSDCSSLRSIELHNGITVIENSAFRKSGLTSIVLPDGITTIAESVFEECADLVSVTIPFRVTVIGAWAFYKCSSLTSITIPDGVTRIEAETFSDCSSLTSIVVPANVTNIRGAAFANCSSLASITLPDGAILDGGGIFAGCSNLTSITLPNNITTIGQRTFANCTNLTSVTLPSGVTNLGGQAFEYCLSLEFVLILGDLTTIESTMQSMFNNTNPNCLIYVSSSTAKLSAVSSWNNVVVKQENGTYQSRNNISLSDGYKKTFHCPLEFTIAPSYTIYYQRGSSSLRYATRAGGWNTLSLPFDAKLQIDGTSKTPVTKSYGGDYWLKSFSSATSDGKITLTNTTDGIIRANTPYLLGLPGSDYEEYSMQGKPVVFRSAVSTLENPVVVKASDDVDYSADVNFSFRCAFTSQIEQPMYLLTPGNTVEDTDSFVLYEEGNISSFRAYFVEVENQFSGVRQLSLATGDETTSLEGISIPDSENEKPHKIMTKDGLRIVHKGKVYTIDGCIVEDKDVIFTNL